MAVYASNGITSVAASLARLMGFSPPHGAGEPNLALERYARAALGGRPVQRALLYHPDGIAHYLFARHTDAFLPVLEAAPLALPMQSVYPPVTPVCFASMYTGLPPEGHGICSYAKPILRVDTLFDAALRAGVRPAIVSTSGSTLSKIFLDRPMDYYILDSVDEVNARAEQLLREDEHDLLLVYNGNYDAAMHRYAPESPEALRALRVEECARAARERWKWIFVDEYQDTSEIQEAILSALVGQGNAFFVGDVKQSIYRFRMAEPELFLRRQARYARGEGGRLIALTANFRSSDGIVDFVNAVFERALRGGDEETAFHRCPCDFGELAEKQLFAVIPEGQGLDEEFLYLGAVHEQEEGYVEDESQVGQESQRVLA